MEYFRWIMVGIGIIILFSVFLLTRHEQNKAKQKQTSDRAKAALGLDPDDEQVKDELKKLKPEIVKYSQGQQKTEDENGEISSARFLQRPADTDPTLPTMQAITLSKDLPEKNIILHVKGNERINGNILLQALNKAGLSFGKGDIFHYKLENNVLFSVANMLNPGTFDLNKINDFSTPGVVMFMHLPGPRNGRTMLVRFLMVAHTLAQELDAVLLDENREKLDYQDLHDLEQEAKLYQAENE